jgi:hypothetical protein
VRLQIAEWPMNDAAGLPALIAELGLQPTEVDLVLDIADEDGVLALTALRQQIATLVSINDWRSLIVAGAGMPKDMPSGQGVFVLPRVEWTRYATLLGGVLPARVPSFADYAIAHPDPTLDIAPKLMSLSATLRYTTNDVWLIGKGQLFKGPNAIGSSAMRPVTQNIAAHAAYLGGQHCATEIWISGVIAQTQNGGNATTWRRYGTQHHLQVVTEQLATLHAALAVR